MGSLFLLFLIGAFAASPVFAADALPGSLTIVTPPDKSFVESGLISIVLMVKKDTADTIRITVNNKEYPLIKKIGGYCVCKGISLSEGHNRITVESLKEGKVIEGKKCGLFLRSDLSGTYAIAPPEYKRYYYHTEGNEQKCVPCHVMERKASDESPQNPEQSSCFICHRRKAEFKFVHGPASAWACLTCHSEKSKDRKYDVLKPTGKVCYPCHSETMDNWQARKYWHGPYSVGSCNMCHDPHASDHPFWLRKQTTDICISCHAEKASGVHVVSGFSGNGHPVRGKRDPRHPGAELSCVSCHNPHTSQFSELLFKDIDNRLSFCRSCHTF